MNKLCVMTCFRVSEGKRNQKNSLTGYKYQKKMFHSFVECNILRVVCESCCFKRQKNFESLNIFISDDV